MSESVSGTALPPSDDLVWQYRRLWDEGSPPDLASFLSGKGEVPMATLAELLDIDQWHRWAAGRRVRAEEYLAAYPRVLDDPEHALRLVYGEFLLRERRGEAPEPVDFAARFPALAERLAQQVELHRALAEPDPPKPAEPPTMAEPGRSPVRSPGTPKVPGFEILAELGRGGMGVVYQARQEKLRRIVALKFLPGGEDSPEVQLRFRREAESAARLQHPNIVQIHEVGDAGGRPYIVMEHVAGGSLADRLDGTPRPPACSAELVETLAWAVHAAHERGVVHRDLKPANVLLASPAGLAQPKIADFGLAKQLDTQQAQTGTNLIVGTPAYMAPEQAAGGSKSVGPAADVYALGVILYECLTGRPPFQGADVVETLQQVRFEDPVPPARLRPGLPRDLETICLKCLEKDPQRRYPTAAALADDLARFRDGRPVLARPTSSVEHAWKWAKRRPGVALLSAATLVSTVLGVALYSVAMAKYAAEREERGRAEGELLVEKTERAESMKRAEVEEWSSYVSGLARAQRMWASDLPSEALLVPGLLQALPGRRRGWEAALFERPRHDAQARAARASSMPVNSLAYSPDGKLLAVGVQSKRAAAGKPNPVQLWDVATGKKLPCLDGHTDSVMRVAFSPDGALLAAASQYSDPTAHLRDVKAFGNKRGRVLVWDVATRRVVHEFNEAYASCCFSADGKRFFAAGQRRIAHAWDTAARPWKELSALPEYSGQIDTLAVSPAGDRLVVSRVDMEAAEAGNYKPVQAVEVWDVSAGRLRFTLGSAALTHYLAYSPDGKRVATVCDDRAVRLWDAETGRVVQTSWGHTAGPRTVGFNRDGSLLVTAGVDGAVRVWSAADGRQLFRFQGAADTVLTAAFDPSAPSGDERLACGDKDGFVRQWRVAGRRQPAELLGHARNLITDLAFSADGQRLVSCSRLDGQAIVWDTATGRPLRRVRSLGERVSVSPDGSRVVTSGGRGPTLADPGEVKLWDATTGKLVHDLKGHPRYVTAAAISPDGRRVLSASGDAEKSRPGEVLIHDLATGNELARIASEVGVVTDVAWSPDGESVALAGQDKAAQVSAWDGRRPRRFEGLDTRAQSVAFGPRGELLACGDINGTIALWDARTGQLLHRLKGHRSSVTRLSFHPDQPRLASACTVWRYYDEGLPDLRPAEADVRLWDLSSGRAALVLPGHMAVAFSPDGKRLALIGGEPDILAPGRIELWDATPNPAKP